MAILLNKIKPMEQIHVTSSNSVLAKRDSEEESQLYDMFGLGVSHNGFPSNEERKEVYKQNQVIYGDIATFQRDYLLTRYYGEGILDQEKIKNLFIDEVDSLCLDKANNVLYLSHDILGLEKLEPIFVFIWKWVSKPAVAAADILQCLDANAIIHAVLYQLYGIINEDDLKSVGITKTKQEFSWLCGQGCIEDLSKDWSSILYENSNKCVGKVTNSNCGEDKLKFLLNQCLNRHQEIRAPNYLQDFIMLHLRDWVENAIKAFRMEDATDYVVDVRKSSENRTLSSSGSAGVVIVDIDTGTDDTNSRWTKGLHQFNQLKHGCPFRPVSLKACFTSNISFLKLYNFCCGTSGTIGGKAERDILNSLYRAKFFYMPSFVQSKFDPKDNIVCTSKSEWLEKISDVVTNVLGEDRGVLIICETILQAKYCKDKLRRSNGDDKLVIYVRENKNLKDLLTAKNAANEEGKLKAGAIICATNLAGRGTDIKLSKEVNKKGGLHVIISFLPKNKRIQDQAFGRAARKEENGSGQIICMNPESWSGANEFKKLVEERDKKEEERLKTILETYRDKTKKEEDLLDEFELKYLAYVNKIKDDSIKELMRASLLNNWAFWLDKNEKSIKTITTIQGSTLTTQFEWFSINQENVRKELDKKESERHMANVLSGSSENFINEPPQQVQLGKYLCFLPWFKDLKEEIPKTHYNAAIYLFKNIIEKENDFCEVASYYLGFVLAKSNDDINKKDPETFISGEDYKEVWECFSKTEKLFRRRMKECSLNSAIIKEYLQITDGSLTCTDGYELQNNRIYQVYDRMIGKINDIFGHPVGRSDFYPDDINVYEAEDLYKEMSESSIMFPAKIVINEKNKEAIKQLESDYGITEGELKNKLDEIKSKSQNEWYGQLKTLNIPERETFWKKLEDHGIIKDPVKYYTVEIYDLRRYDENLFNNLNKDANNYGFKNLGDTKEVIFLHGEIAGDECGAKLKFILTEEQKKKIITKEKLEVLKSWGCVAENWKASVNQSNFNINPFGEKITTRDIQNMLNLPASVVRKLVDDLVEKKIFNKYSYGYQLNENYLKNNKQTIDDFTSGQPLFDHIMKMFIQLKFPYTIAYSRFKQDFLKRKENTKKDEDKPVIIKLFPDPVSHLMSDLMHKQIMLPLLYQKMRPEGFNSEQKKLTDDSFKSELGNINDDASNKILENVNSKRGKLFYLKYPKWCAERLTYEETDGRTSNKEETQAIYSYGFSHVIEVREGEEPPDPWYWLKVIGVFLLGLVQIVFGAAIKIFSCGILSDVGDVFISEGIEDLVYSVDAIVTGKFDINDWWEKKKARYAQKMSETLIVKVISFIVKCVKFAAKIICNAFKGKLPTDEDIKEGLSLFKEGLQIGMSLVSYVKNIQNFAPGPLGIIITAVQIAVKIIVAFLNYIIPGASKHLSFVVDLINKSTISNIKTIATGYTGEFLTDNKNLEVIVANCVNNVAKGKLMHTIKDCGRSTIQGLHEYTNKMLKSNDFKSIDEVFPIFDNMRKNKDTLMPKVTDLINETFKGITTELAKEKKSSSTDTTDYVKNMVQNVAISEVSYAISDNLGEPVSKKLMKGMKMVEHYKKASKKDMDSKDNKMLRQIKLRLINVLDNPSRAEELLQYYNSQIPEKPSTGTANPSLASKRKRRSIKNGYSLDETVDKDLRVPKRLLPMEAKAQLVNAFNEALFLINDFFVKLDPLDMDPVVVVPKDFRNITKFATTIGPRDMQGKYYKFLLAPVEIQTAKHYSERSYNIFISINNPKKTTDKLHPAAPHVQYRIYEGVKLVRMGHVVLNESENVHLIDNDSCNQTVDDDAKDAEKDWQAISQLFLENGNPMLNCIE